MPESLYLLELNGRWFAYPTTDRTDDRVPVASFPSQEWADEFVRRWHAYQLANAEGK